MTAFEFPDDWVDCYQCGGEGFDDNMCECERVVDVCHCLVPEPVHCQICRGAGGWEPES